MKYQIGDQLYIKSLNKVPVHIIEIKNGRQYYDNFIYGIIREDKDATKLWIAESWLLTEDEYDAWRVMEVLIGH